VNTNEGGRTPELVDDSLVDVRAVEARSVDEIVNELDDVARGSVRGSNGRRRGCQTRHSGPGVLYRERGVAELPVPGREHDILIEH
jgi:hypothetical protein